MGCGYWDHSQREARTRSRDAVTKIVLVKSVKGLGRKKMLMRLEVVVEVESKFENSFVGFEDDGF